MKKYLALLALLLLVTPASADYIVKDGGGNLQTIKSGVLGTGTYGPNILPWTMPVDSSGTAISFATQTTLASVLSQLQSVNHFICDSGCGGGGGGLSVPYGGAIGANGTPVGLKDPATGFLQPFQGDTTNGLWTNIKASITLPISVASLPLPSGAATQTTSAATLAALGSPFQAGGSIGNTTFAATQSVASALNATVVGTGTFAVQLTGATNNINNISGVISLPTGAATQTTSAAILSALGTPFQAGGSIGNTTFASTQSGNWSVRNVGAAGATLDFAGQNATGTVNAFLTGGQFNTTPTTITAGNFSPFQLDNAGNLLVNVKVGGGTGGTSSTFGASFPSTGTAGGMTQGGLLTAMTGTSGNLNVQCANCSGSGVSTVDKATFTVSTSLFAGGGGFFQTTATSNPLTTGQQGMFQLTAQRAMFSNLRDSTGTELGVAAAPLQVSLANTAANGTAVSISGTVTANAGTNLNTSLLALESGHLSTIDTKTPALGQALAASSVPVVLTAAQITTLTPPAAITGFALDTSVATTNTKLTTLTTNLGSPFQAGGSIGNTTFAATQATAASLNATVVGTGTFATQLTGATNNINNIAGTVSLPTGAATSALQTTGNTSLATIATNSGNPLPLNVNTVTTAWTGLTPGVAQTGTIVAANVDFTSVGGTAALRGAGAVGTGSQRVAVGTDTSTIAGSAPGVTGTPSTNVVTVQGAAGMTPVVAGTNVAVPTTPTIQAAAYASGNAVGALQTVAVFRTTNQPSGILNAISLAWKGTETTALTFFVFDTNPSGSTCTDKTAFSLATADVPKLALPPFTLTAAAPAVGTTFTSAISAFSPVSVKNQDGSPTVNLYVCAVSGGAFTPAVGDLTFKTAVALD